MGSDVAILRIDESLRDESLREGAMARREVRSLDDEPSFLNFRRLSGSELRERRSVRSILRLEHSADDTQEQPAVL